MRSRKHSLKAGKGDRGKEGEREEEETGAHLDLIAAEEVMQNEVATLAERVLAVVPHAVEAQNLHRSEERRARKTRDGKLDVESGEGGEGERVKSARAKMGGRMAEKIGAQQAYLSVILQELAQRGVVLGRVSR